MNFHRKSKNRRLTLNPEPRVNITQEENKESEDILEIIEEEEEAQKPFISFQFISECFRESDKYCKQASIDFLTKFLNFKPEMYQLILHTVLEEVKNPLEDLQKGTQTLEAIF